MTRLSYLSMLTFALLLPMGAWAQSPASSGSPVAVQDELEIHAINEVPEAVMAAVKTVAPDVYFTEAKSFWLDDWRVYSLSGRLFREVWDVLVRSDGKVLRVGSDLQDD